MKNDISPQVKINKINRGRRILLEVYIDIIREHILL